MAEENQHGNEGDKSSSENRDFVTKDELGNMVNSAVRDHMKRNETKMSKLLADGFADLKESFGAPPKDGDDSSAGAKGAGGDGEGDKPNPELTAVKRQLTQQSNKLNTEIAARELAEKRVADDGLKSKVSEALGLHNINGNRQSAAMALLYQNGRVKIAEDGVHLYVDTNGDELPLSEGLKSWAGSDEAKLFTPPREVKGSGDKGQGRVATFKGKDSGLNDLIQGGHDAAQFLIDNQ